MKTCRICKEQKPLAEYHNDKRGKDGKSSTCKACKRSIDRCRYCCDSETIKTRVKRYQAGEGRAVVNAVKAEYKKRHPKKAKAHGKVAYAIKKGILIRQPCQECKSTRHVVAHHDDYDQPLAIRWLCEDCHKQWHLIHGEALNPC